MRYSQEVTDALKVPDNVKLLSWLPQNDLLGHKSTQLFITHGGANSQFEALFHAVPMIVFPLFGDQPYNAKRGEYKGYSLTMDILSFTPEQLVTNIRRITHHNSSYSSNIQKGSAIFRSSHLDPRKRALHWIEHVMQYGGEHLRSYALDMPWYQYLMLDVGLCYLCILSVILVLIPWCLMHLFSTLYSCMELK